MKENSAVSYLRRLAPNSYMNRGRVEHKTFSIHKSEAVINREGVEPKTFLLHKQNLINYGRELNHSLPTTPAASNSH